MKKFLVILFIVICISGLYRHFDDYYTPRPYLGTIVAMSNIESGGKYSHSQPTLGVKLDTGRFHDYVTSIAAYSQWHIGDRIVIHQCDKEVHPIWWKTALDCISFVGLIFFSTMFVFLVLVRLIEGKKFQENW